MQRHHGVADVVEGVCCAMLQLGLVHAVVPDTARALLEAVKQLGPVEDAQLLNRIVKAVTLVACSTEQARSVLMNGGLCENVMAFVRWRRVQGGHPSSDQPFRSLLLLCEYISRSREACQRLMTLPQNLPQFLSQCLGTWAEDEPSYPLPKSRGTRSETDPSCAGAPSVAYVPLCSYSGIRRGRAAT